MRIFLAGGSGAIGKRLVPLLVAHGHQVVATTTSPGKVEAFRLASASPVGLDALNRDAVMKAVVSARPDGRR